MEPSLKEKLMDKLTISSCLTKETEMRLDTARKSLDEKRKRFLRSRILHQVITDISMDPICPVQSQLSERLTLAELTGYIDIGRRESSDHLQEGGGDKQSDLERATESLVVTTLGLDQKDISITNSDPEFDKVLRESIEERLFEVTKSLHLMISPDSEPETRRSLLHPHLLRLHDKISDMVTSVEQQTAEMASLHQTLDQRIRKQNSVLEEMSTHLDTLITKYFSGTKLENTSVLVQYMRSKCETIRLKLKCLELEILHTTYNKDAIKAIRSVRQSLLDKTRQQQSKLAALNNTIAQYSAVGPEFTQLVATYAQLLKQIQDKKWALQELTGEVLVESEAAAAL